MKEISVGIIGAGNMGGAIIQALARRRGFHVCVSEIDRGRARRIKKLFPVRFLSAPELTNVCRTLIICVKPQDIDAALAGLTAGLTPRHTLISIAAGVGTRSLEQITGPGVPVVRAMPNMPVLVGEGVTVYCLGAYARSAHARLARAVFAPLGLVLEAEEKLMNAVTAVSASGPGFIAYFLDAYVGAAKKCGLNADTARRLCLRTWKGTMELLAQKNIGPSELVRRVASKKGTTQAGLDVFHKRHLPLIIEQGLQAARFRAAELNRAK